MAIQSSGQDNMSVNRINPEGLSNCIWVDAGLVSYKLCDREFECEACPFDQIMRQESRRAPKTSSKSGNSAQKSDQSESHLSNREDFAGLVNDLLNPSSIESLPVGQCYSRNHLWLKKIEENRYRLGLDGYAASLFHDPLTVILPRVGASSIRNAPIAWLILEDGTIAVRSPLEGDVLRVNFKLRESPEVIKDDPYNSGWLCDIAVNDDGVLKSVWMEEKVARDFYRQQFSQCGQMIISGFEHRPNEVGRTMADGGRRLKTVKDLLGSKGYVSFLKTMLSSPL